MKTAINTHVQSDENIMCCCDGVFTAIELMTFEI